MTISAENLFFRYNHYHDAPPVLRDVSFTLHSGDCLALIGPSGSGKSTLAQHLNGLLKPQSGRLCFDNEPLGWAPRELRDLRRRVGLIFQFPETQIFESTVADEVGFAAAQWNFPPADIPDRVAAALQSVGLDPERFLQRNPLNLSGGEARLVSIASLLIVDPEWLILDEPTLGLDLAHRECVIELIRNRRSLSKSTMLITHDMNLVYETCPRAIVLKAGGIHYDGPTLELLVKHEMVEEFGLDQPNVIALWKALKAVRETYSIAGDFPDPNLQDIGTWIAAQKPERREQLCSVLRLTLDKIPD